MLAVALLVISLPIGASVGDAQGDKWFQPKISTKNDPSCGDFLKMTGTDTPHTVLKEVPSFYSDADRGNSSVQSVPDRRGLLTFTQRGAKALYVAHIRNPGCGGACETESLALYASAPSYDQLEKPTIVTPAAEGWSIYETTSGRQFVAGVVDRQLEVYSASPAAEWRLACRIQLEPDLQHSEDPRVRKAVASLNALRDAAENIAGGEGYGWCGTMHTAIRWRGDFEHALGQVLFDPDASTVAAPEPPSENSYGDYARIYKALEDWSLGGLFEYRSLQQYDSQLRATTAVVGDFYQYRFHWTESQSSENAGQAITGAVSRLFGFYMYEPFNAAGERELRRALLTHRPMETIRAITFDPKQIDGEGVDSILNVAIEYPEALSYLLSRGVEPDHPNSFGKTPLMYAAQYNQLQAVQILLRAGADPNATTAVAPDNCDYAIQKHHVTPLHYAVKYASRELVQTLLAAGAVTFIRTENWIDPSQGSYPLEWLQAAANANLSAEDVKALERSLQIPATAERAKLSATLVAAAEASNAAARTGDAYHAIRLARLADPTNERVTADLPLLALKAGAIGPALEGSGTAIANAKTPADKAAALFNQALACLQVPTVSARYNNTVYCEKGYIDPFLLAWKAQPTASRARKLEALLGDKEPGNCIVTLPGAGTATFRFLAVFDSSSPGGQVERIYALHPPRFVIDPSAIRWDRLHVAPRQEINPRVIERLTLDQEHALTILEGDSFATSVFVNGTECHLGDSAASPRPL